MMVVMPICGDSLCVGNEVCDDGAKNGIFNCVYGIGNCSICNSNCIVLCFSFCGVLIRVCRLL